MSSRKRSYPYAGAGGATGASKQRSVGGRLLTYRSSAPVYGSSRYRASLGPVSRQALRTGGWANPTQGAELKFTDTGTTQNLFATAAFIAPAATTLMNGLVPNSTATGRIGRKIVMKSVYVRWSFNLGAASTNGAPVRVIIFYDKQANATAPAVTDVLLTDDFCSANNLSNRDRFVTICDEISQPIGVNSEWMVAGTIYKKLNLETMYNAGTAGTIGDITSGSLYIMFGQGGTIGGTAPAFKWTSRVRYTDN